MTFYVFTIICLFFGDQNIRRLFFSTLVRILLALEKAGNLSFGHFYLSFFSIFTLNFSVFSLKFPRFLPETWVFRKIYLSFSKKGLSLVENLSFMPTWVLAQVLKKKAWISCTSPNRCLANFPIYYDPKNNAKKK